MMKWLILALTLLATAAHAQYQTYVIHTYGDPSLVGVVQSELSARGGGTAKLYQDKLIVRATPTDYAHVSALVRQIDTTPTPLTIQVAVANTINHAQTSGGVQVGISGQIWINGHYQNEQSTHQASNSYTARTLSGSEVSIGTQTLIGLANWQGYQRGGRYWVNFGTSWVALNDGFTATPKALPSGQISLSLHSTTQNPNHAASTLNTTLTLPRGQWVKAGEIRTDTATGTTYSHGTYSQTMPIWLRVD